MKKAVCILFSATIFGLFLSPTLKVVPLIQNHTSESVMMLILGLSLIGVARIFRAKEVRIKQ